VHETFCQTIQEALASGVPVVAPAQGGPVDLVTPRVNGLLYRAGDSRDLRACVVSLLDDFARASLAAHARPSVEHRTWKAVNDQLLAHFARACKQVDLAEFSPVAVPGRETVDAV
jgi:phosphatidylinositol alpha 1,6-mannosyltransferase